MPLMTAHEFRRIALSLPQASEAAHMGHRAQPAVFAPVEGGWGRGGATNVRLRAARKGAVREAVITAWRNRAPKRLAQQMDHS